MSDKRVTTQRSVHKLSVDEQLALATTGSKEERLVLACYSRFAEVNDVLRKDKLKSVRFTARVHDPRISGLSESSSAAAAILTATIL